VLKKKKKCKETGCNNTTFGTLCNYHKGKKAVARKKERDKDKPLPKAGSFKIKPKKKSTKKKLTRIGIFKKNAWDCFSLRIRLEDSDETGTVKCCTCPRTGFFYNDIIDGGHFQSRVHTCVFLSRFNVSGQCKNCNGRGSGQQYAHGKYLDARWGNGTADKMEALAKTTCKMIHIDYIESIKESVSLCETYLKVKKISKDVHDKIWDRLEYYKRFIKREEAVLNEKNK